MDILANYRLLLYVIAVFLILVVVLPFVFKEIKKKKESGKLINRIIPVSSLTEKDLEKIETLHPEGKKMHPLINTAVCVGCGTCVLNCIEKDTLYLVNGKSTLVNPLACKCRGECERHCPTGALRLVEYGKKMKVKIPETDENFETNIKGIYIVGALSGAGLIKEAINQGRAAVNHIMRDVFPPNLPVVAVVGAGPAGLSALLSCRKFGLPVVCLEKENTANTIRNFPKKKILMAEPVEMPIFGPLWVGDTTREVLLAAWDRILKKTGVRITTGARLEMIEGKDGQFMVTASGNRYACHKVILALGSRGVPRKLAVPGEDGPNVFYNLLDAEEFAGSTVTIVGAGDSAVEAALSLLQQYCRVTMVVRGDGFPRAKSKNREKIERAIKEKKITAYFNSYVNEIGSEFVTLSDSKNTFRIVNDYVFVMVGGELPFQLLEKIGIHIVEKEI
jgi:thioredoxin reductase (NADPH)